MDNSDIKKVVNKILSKDGLPKVTKFAAEFADGILFQRLFNLIYDEHIDCKLQASADTAVRLNNWSRINQVICFNYLQQRFYLVEPTMKMLAKGTNADAILKLIKVLLDTQQSDFEAAVAGDTKALHDIADELNVEKPVMQMDEKDEQRQQMKGDVNLADYELWA